MPVTHRLWGYFRFGWRCVSLEFKNMVTHFSLALTGYLAAPLMYICTRLILCLTGSYQANPWTSHNFRMVLHTIFNNWQFNHIASRSANVYIPVSTLSQLCQVETLQILTNTYTWLNCYSTDNDSQHAATPQCLLELICRTVVSKLLVTFYIILTAMITVLLCCSHN